MKNSIKKILFISIIILLSGCTFKQTVLDINHYSIDFKSSNKALLNSGKSIYIEAVDVNKSFDKNSIFYTIKPYLFEEYAINRWINQPNYMIHNQLVQSLEHSNIFKTVFGLKSSIEFDYTLKTNVVSLYHEVGKDKSYAIVKVRFNVLANKQILKTYIYDKKILCQSTNAYGFVVGVNKAFEEVVNDLILQLAKIK